LRREDAAEFIAVYESMQPIDRPPLTPYFHSHWYLQKNPDVGASGDDPLLHFIQLGMAQRRSPHPLINLDYIEQRRGRFSRGVAGLRELFSVLSQGTVQPSPYFEQECYVAANPDALGFATGPLGHFVEAPGDECFVPCQPFDADFYIARYPDVPRSRREAFLHFCAVGDLERRLPGPKFDSDWYFFGNGDLAQAEVPPLYHYLEFGRTEGRSPVNPNGRSIGLLTQAASPTGGLVPVSHESGRVRYEALRARLKASRARQVEAVPEREARPVILNSTSIPDFAVPQSATPKVSIIIPVYNEFRVTLECLKSIAQSRLETPVEVIVGDDCSTDPAIDQLANIPGLIYVRHRKNLNFLRNCNALLPSCRGQFILLLNNDAQVCDDTIDLLCRMLEVGPTVGAVGPKILYPNGRLQEAGCTIAANATTEMVGVFESPANPSYNYPRDVDYASGAALMVRRSLLGDTLFDEELAPAYCEDQDLCLRIRAQGYRIRYVPDAVVVHHLSVTMADHGLKMQRIVKNQHTVFAKWHDQLAEMNRVRVIAFYLPQFHPIPENDLWWGKGFTEWTNVSKALPSYRDHYQPHLPADLGFYDLRVPQVYREQANLIRKYGLEGVCIYYYNFNGEAFLSRPLEIILSETDIPIKFCLCWANENWSRRWDGGDQELLLEQRYDSSTVEGVLEDFLRAARDPRYITIDNCPVFLIYRPMIIPEAANVVATLREKAHAELGVDLHVIFVESMESFSGNVNPHDYGFDASVEFPPHGLAEPASDQRDILKDGWVGHRYDYEQTIQRAIMRPGVGWQRYPSVFPSWDNTARQPLKGTSFDNGSPEAFKLYAEEKIAECRRLFVGEQRIVFVNAWNEWAEGAHLEPDLAYGHGWLEVLRDAIRSAT
jgi:GT2 family glycosyltransferase